MGLIEKLRVGPGPDRMKEDRAEEEFRGAFGERRQKHYESAATRTGTLGSGKTSELKKPAVGIKGKQGFELTRG